MTDLTALWYTNRRWRAWMDANTEFKTPDTLDALRYMDGETREVRDLIMRQQQPVHARNNSRHSTVEQELADVVMMALTALGELSHLPRWWNGDVTPTDPDDEGNEFDVDWMCDTANSAVMMFKEEPESFWHRSVYNTVAYVLAYPGLDLPAELDRCWRRLAWKHGGYQWYEQTKAWGMAVENAPAPWLVEEPNT